MAISATVFGGLMAGNMVMQHQALSAQKDANAQAQKNAKATADAAIEASNKANQKKPDVAGLLAANTSGGQGGTMLTGPTGIDPSILQLGKTTLLGGGT